VCLCPTLHESLDCPFIFLAPLLFSNIYLTLHATNISLHCMLCTSQQKGL
jgi:hypothetical protein